LYKQAYPSRTRQKMIMGITNTKVETYSHEAFLDLMLLTALEGDDQIAIWKKPKEHLVYVIIDKTQ